MAFIFFTPLNIFKRGGNVELLKINIISSYFSLKIINYIKKIGHDLY